MSPRAALIATLAEPLAPGGGGKGLPPLPAAVEWLELRADLAGDVPAATLAAAFPGRLVYTLRSRAEGGAHEATAERRKRRLLDASEGFDLVDLEAERDLSAEVLARIPPERRLVSWHGPAATAQALRDRFERMSEVPARLYKLVPTAAQPGEELAPLLLLQSLGRDDVVAFAAGRGGAWTRLVAPRLGAPVVYGAAGAVPGAPGQPTVASLCRDYGLPELPPAAALFGVVGDPVEHSLSPRLHNAGYRALGIPALYLAFHAASLGDFWLEVVESPALESLGLPVRGLSITAPHKQAALAIGGAESPLAGRIGAANTLAWHDGVWEAESTDPEGIVLPLAGRGVRLDGIEAAVVGAGGAGRAAAVGLLKAGARVTIANRGGERGRRAAEDLGVPFVPLAELEVAGFRLVVNATALGRRADDPLPFDVAALPPGAAVVDLVYLEDRPTRLVVEAAARGLTAVEGREVLLGQALGQFRLMTGREMPLAVGRRALGLPEDPATPEDAP